MGKSTSAESIHRSRQQPASNPIDYKHIKQIISNQHEPDDHDYSKIIRKNRINFYHAGLVFGSAARRTAFLNSIDFYPISSSTAQAHRLLFVLCGAKVRVVSSFIGNFCYCIHS